MDAIRFDTPKTEAEFEPLKQWLAENGRIITRPDNLDGTIAFGWDTDTDLSLVRDVENNRIHYAKIANPEVRATPGFQKSDFKIGRFVHQMDRPPTPFPAELQSRRVDV